MSGGRLGEYCTLVVAEGIGRRPVHFASRRHSVCMCPDGTGYMQAFGTAWVKSGPSYFTYDEIMVMGQICQVVQKPNRKKKK